MSTLGEIGEREMIRRLTAGLPTRPDVLCPVGDDAAVVRVEGAAHDFLLTSDAVVENSHFLPGIEPERIGHKAIGRGLSDLAAMGGEPLWALMDLVAPPTLDAQRIERAYRGAGALAGRFGLAIVGGDTTSGPVLELHVFAVGRVPRGAALLRSGAKPGEAVYVTGALGGSLCGKHFSFEPRVREGAWLREGGWACAMIDLSDGLATDARHLAEMSGVRIELEAGLIPMAEAARAPGGKRAPLERALFDGEDFELLFTVAPGKQSALETEWKNSFPLPLTHIGRVAGGPVTVALLGPEGAQDLPNGGFEHFKM